MLSKSKGRKQNLKLQIFPFTTFYVFCSHFVTWLVGPNIAAQMMNYRPSDELENENKSDPDLRDPRTLKGTLKTKGFLRQKLQTFAANRYHHF